MLKTIVFFIITFYSIVSFSEERFLQLQFNKSTWIRIANVPCPVKELKIKYPYGAVSYNEVRKEYLFGCFTNEGDDIVIQWAGGDKSVFPANAFLMSPNT